MESVISKPPSGCPMSNPTDIKISVFVWDGNPTEGYGFFLPHHFSVTDH
jgi:hypothetical protein